MSEEAGEIAAAPSSAPLAGRTIVITRALGAQADAFADELKAYGARVILCPMIEIVPPASYAEMDDAIDHLYGYDWLIFTSANSVEHFLRRLAERDFEAADLDELRVCAIGDATADKLRDASVHVDVVPDEFKAEGVFAALAEYVGGREALSGLNFLIPRAALARDYLPQHLEAAGARADAVAAYRTVRPQQTMARAQLEALLAGGAIDCLTFTSSSTVKNFAALFETADLGGLLTDVKVACLGDITAQTAADYSLRCHIQPREFTTPALARSIADYFARN